MQIDTAVQGRSRCVGLHWIMVSAENLVLPQGDSSHLRANLEMNWINSDLRTIAGYL